MKRRRRLWLILALVLLAGIALLSPNVWWHLVGWWKGEAFYKGRPTTYWQMETQSIQMSYDRGSGPENGAEAEDPPPPPATPAPLDTILRWFGHERFEFEEWYLLKGDPACLPVLLEMLRGDDIHARRVACWGLISMRDAARPAIPALRAALKDPSRLVRHDAELALKVIDPEGPRD